MIARAVILPPPGAAEARPIIPWGVACSAQLLKLVAAHVPSAISANTNAATVPPRRRVAVTLDPTARCILRAHLTGQGAS